MDTTQKTREEAAKSRPRKDAPKSAEKRPATAKRPEGTKGAPPASAQQSNGAARTAMQQQKAAGEKMAQKPAPQKPVKKKQAPAKKAVPVKKKPSPAKPDPNDVPNKKRAYGNSKPKKKSAVSKVGDVFKQTAAKTKTKKAGKKPQQTQQNVPAVIYTQPQAFNRNRLLVHLATVVAVVAALVMGLSVFFKVERITVTGADVYSAWSVVEASGIEEGDNLLSFSHARAGALIKANLPYVDTVRFGIKLPDTVNIIIEEADVVYSVKDSTGMWWLINSNGRVVEQTSSGKAANYTQILGVTLETPIKNEPAVAVEAIPEGTYAEGETIPVTVTGAQRLNTALQIVRALEQNDVVGAAASVDVAILDDIVLWYGSRYQVNLGDSSRIEHKIASMNDVILQLSDFDSGILDVSFTIWADRAIYTPFA